MAMLEISGGKNRILLIKSEETLILQILNPNHKGNKHLRVSS